jgi:AcrR family transcriptional regulator
MATPDTQQTILDAAERLFAEHGYADTSLRAVIKAAGVNLAAVHYHFGSKEALLEAVLARRFRPINEERLARLEEIQAAAGRAGPKLGSLLEALIAPVLRRKSEGREGAMLVRLGGRMMSDPAPDVQRIFMGQFREVAARFFPAIHQALPSVPREELAWRIHFMIGALAHTMCGTDFLKYFHGDVVDLNDVEGITRRLVAFVAAGMSAPLPRRARAPNRMRPA